uniref:BTB domain-containing protein n=1 Tax=Panagrolaimus davidi TaxID=227884 RepID=A0A914NZU1_9BILA
MLQQITFVRTAQLDKESETTIKVSDSLEFTVKRHIITHFIKNIKGDFEITKIVETYDDGERHVLMYDKSSTSFQAHDRSSSETKTLTFYITAMIEMTELKEIKGMKDMCIVKYELQIPPTILQRLEICQFYKSQFVLPGYDGLKFTYYVKKINVSTANDIEIMIENPYNVEIDGKKGDYYFVCDSTESIIYPFLFTFYTDEIPITEETKPNSNELHGLQQESSNDESRPESVIPSFTSKSTTLLHKLATDHRYADVYFIASDGEKIPSYRNILAASSDVFLKIFDETTEIPVQITANDFDAQTIQSALNFLYDKSDSIIGKEKEVFKFAIKFGIQILIDECRSVFEESVDSTNVCEFIEIAYSNNFEHLKQKCLRILAEKKEEIDLTKVAELPKNIFFDIYCFKL